MNSKKLLDLKEKIILNMDKSDLISFLELLSQTITNNTFNENINLLKILDDKGFILHLSFFNNKFSEFSKINLLDKVDTEIRKRYISRLSHLCKEINNELKTKKRKDWYAPLISLLSLDRKEESFKKLIVLVKNELNLFLEKKTSDNEISSMFGYLFLDNENLELLKMFEPRIEELTEGIDISDPSWSRKRKEELAKKLIKKIDDILIS